MTAASRERLRKKGEAFDGVSSVAATAPPRARSSARLRGGDDGAAADEAAADEAAADEAAAEGGAAAADARGFEATSTRRCTARRRTTCSSTPQRAAHTMPPGTMSSASAHPTMRT